ncbi:transglycosylase domain-containing protein [Streptomyces angustmyceticus]|uniref:Penicillin-binding protein n=2 Tax=Streptomyces angustmyceticus TaxID=285578 RepID=A0A5J4LAU9_9ACTN|nr:transglycosylase domain-containing protein [Streptomyces angustmyceticus]UAL69030.1 penicillin-binding protein [Streptomyces angustmyceticus]GES29734.1 penicillin-binding protein [Streptomyces angustmyceticus]
MSGQRTGWRRVLPTWRTVLGTVLLFLLLIIGGLVTGYLLVGIPPANSAAKAQSTVYLYSDGSELARDGEVNRQNVTLGHVPKSVQQAVLAAEDRDFYAESAVDPAAMLRAAWNTVTGKGKQSGSTITQQYVKNYYLGQEQTVTRKAKEFFIAIKLDREVSKDNILEGYLNSSYYGRNAYGIQAAAQSYYGRNAEQLTTAQGAYLATLLNAPSAYDITARPANRARVLARWNYVLDGMVKQKWLSQADRAALEFPMPRPAKPSAGLSGQRGYLVEAVKDYLVDHRILDEDTLRAGGYRITTTIGKKRQNALVKAVNTRLMDRLDDSRKVDRCVRAGGASIDPASGRVVALYGGIDYARQFVNSATRRDYQVGSTFKPIVFASAVQNDATTQNGERITPNTVYDGTNKRMTVNHGTRTGFAPANEDDRSYGPITVSEATDKSVNAVYAQMGIDVGPAKVKATAVDLGIPADTPSLASSQGAISLGTATPSVLDMTQVYATLAHHGTHRPYSLVDKVTRNEEAVELPEREETTAVPRTAADTTTSILRSVVDGGTGTAAQGAGRPAAGKTGTAEDDKAAWFAGYTPDLATVVAVLGQNPESAAQEPLYGAGGLARVNGGDYPAQIWADYTAAALKGRPVRDFSLRLEEGAESASPSPSGSDSASPDESGSPSAGPSDSPGAPTPTPGGPTRPTGGPTAPTSPAEPTPTAEPTNDVPTFEPQSDDLEQRLRWRWGGGG